MLHAMIFVIQSCRLCLTESLRCVIRTEAGNGACFSSVFGVVPVILAVLCLTNQCWFDADTYNVEQRL